MSDPDQDLGDAIVKKVHALIKAELEAAGVTGERHALLSSMIAAGSVVMAGSDEGKFAQKVVMNAISTLVMVAQVRGWIKFACENCGAGLDPGSIFGPRTIQ